MSFKVQDPNDESKEIEVFTPDEVAAKDAEITAAKADAEKFRADADKYQKVSAEKTENFKKLNEMTESEKAALSAEKIEFMKRAEAAEAKVSNLEDKFNKDTQDRINADTEAALKKYHGDDPKMKEVLEKNFKLISLEGTDTNTIYERARLAAAMEAGKTGRANPLMSPMNGSAPRSQQSSKSEEFLKSEKAQEAMKRMGN